jgi:hypothetical protein
VSSCKCAGGGLAGGLAVAVWPSLRPLVCIQLGSCLSASCGRHLPLRWVSVVGVCASC